MKRLAWDEYAVLLAITAAGRSEDPWYQVGAVVLRADHSVAGVGYNGAPSGVDLDWSDRDLRRLFVIHAEINALRFARADEVRDGLLAVSHRPCANCLRTAASYQIRTVAFAQDVDQSVYPPEEALIVAANSGIELRKVVFA